MFPFLAQSLARPPARWHVTAAATLAVLLALELFGLRILDTSELRLNDVLMVRHAADYRADPDIVIVDIDDASLTAMQDIAGLWPWPREIHADLLTALADFQPRAIVFDISFSERDVRRPKSDALFADTVAAIPDIYLPAVLLDSASNAAGTGLTDVVRAFGIARAGQARAQAALQLPQVVHAEAWRLGLINNIEDVDGVMRRYRLYTDVQGWRLPSLPARVAADLGADMPTDDGMMLRWPAHGHQRYAYGELFLTLTEERSTLAPAALDFLEQRFRNKIIVIGASAASSFDHHVTPLGPGYPGVDVLAVALDNIKNEHGVRAVSRSIPFGFGVILLALLAVLFIRRSNPLVIGVALALVTASMFALMHGAFGLGWHLPLLTPAVSAWSMFVMAVVAGFVIERRSREQAVALFGRFLNPDVVRQIVEQGQTVESLSGRTRNITVLFSDIRGFTTLSEARPPDQVVALLNRHFERQVEVVFRHGGTLDKFIGDCIMAFWGAPLDDPDHARHAVAAALEMQDALLAFKQELAESGADVGQFDVGIGVHSGPAVVGFIGARRKLDYTAIGDTVNLANRVEGLTKGVARVLVTRDTMSACGSDAFRFVAHGAFAVKGRAAEVELYEPTRKST